MNYITLMTICDRWEYLLYYHGSIILIKLCLNSDFIEKFPTSAQLSDYV